MPAHNLLWRECEKSSDNVTARLAVIPLVQVVFCSWVCIFVTAGIVSLDKYVFTFFFFVTKLYALLLYLLLLHMSGFTSE
jgi:hypothetical protein